MTRTNSEAIAQFSLLSCTVLTPIYQYAPVNILIPVDGTGSHPTGHNGTTGNAFESYPLGISVGIPIMTEGFRGFPHYLDAITGVVR